MEQTIRRPVMKIAVASADGTTLSPHFGRSTCFIVFDTNDGKVIGKEVFPYTNEFDPGVIETAIKGKKTSTVSLPDVTIPPVIYWASKTVRNMD